MTHNHSVTIPPHIIRNAGEPVFPALRARIGDNPRLLQIIIDREAYGFAKYGQTLMTDDSRDTNTEIINEAADLLAYVTKRAMQQQTKLAWDLVAVTIQFVDYVIEDIDVGAGLPGAISTEVRS
jgi:hypothetical protein